MVAGQYSLLPIVPLELVAHGADINLRSIVSGQLSIVLWMLVIGATGGSIDAY